MTPDTPPADTPIRRWFIARLRTDSLHAISSPPITPPPMYFRRIAPISLPQPRQSATLMPCAAFCIMRFSRCQLPLFRSCSADAMPMRPEPDESRFQRHDRRRRWLRQPPFSPDTPFRRHGCYAISLPPAAYFAFSFSCRDFASITIMTFRFIAASAGIFTAGFAAMPRLIMLSLSSIFFASFAFRRRRRFRHFRRQAALSLRCRDAAAMPAFVTPARRLSARQFSRLFAAHAIISADFRRASQHFDCRRCIPRRCAIVAPAVDS